VCVAENKLKFPSISVPQNYLVAGTRHRGAIIISAQMRMRFLTQDDPTPFVAAGANSRAATTLPRRCGRSRISQDAARTYRDDYAKITTPGREHANLQYQFVDPAAIFAITGCGYATQ